MSEPVKFDYAMFDKLLDSKGPVMLAGQQLLKIAAISDNDIVFPPSYANPSEKKDDPPAPTDNPAIDHGAGVAFARRHRRNNSRRRSLAPG